MNFKYFFSALALTSALLFSSCEKKSDTPTPVTQLLNCPDSVQVYAPSDAGEYLMYTRYCHYDTNGNLLLDSTSTYKELMSYDARNNLLEKKTYSFDRQHNTWYGTSKWIYTYDDKNKLSSMTRVEQFTDGVEDKPLKKVFYSWLDDLHSEGLVYRCIDSGDSVVWKYEGERVEYVYNSSGKELNEKYYWNYDQQHEKADLEYSWEYNQHHHLTSYIFRLWNYSRNEYETATSQTYSYSYDEAGNILTKSTYNNLPDGPMLIQKDVYYYSK